MKLLIASDIHGSSHYCRMLVERYGMEAADRMLLLGDILYHGPRNALPERYDPKEVISMLNAMKNSIMCVKGNCDTQVDQMVLDFPIMADYCILESSGHLIYATHGHQFNTKTPPPLCKGDILLHGHTHIPAAEMFGDGCLYLNPGSVSIPKKGSPHGYMTLEDGIVLWKDLNGGTYKELSLQEV